MYYLQYQVVINTSTVGIKVWVVASVCGVLRIPTAGSMTTSEVFVPMLVIIPSSGTFDLSGECLKVS